jgi:hypothetical protein
MQQLIRRIAFLESLAQLREVRRCICVRRYRGETVADALAAEGHEPESSGMMVISFRRPYQRDAHGGQQ